MQRIDSHVLNAFQAGIWHISQHMRTWITAIEFQPLAPAVDHRKVEAGKNLETENLHREVAQLWSELGNAKHDVPKPQGSGQEPRNRSTGSKGVRPKRLTVKQFMYKTRRIDDSYHAGNAALAQKLRCREFVVDIQIFKFFQCSFERMDIAQLPADIRETIDGARMHTETKFAFIHFQADCAVGAPFAYSKTENFRTKLQPLLVARPLKTQIP